MISLYTLTPSPSGTIRNGSSNSSSSSDGGNNNNGSNDSYNSHINLIIFIRSIRERKLSLSLSRTLFPPPPQRSITEYLPY
ncbi:LOW QUALITY PROTEIN: putative abc transporter subunit [Schistosoma mansoni]|uniref:putative abc transporter subunit n=1 Tax=Schistosoma mansoni TaxID=6183 RepID=UPI00022DC861|nr:LOW QUALITY PROTEIN: putative abc transporter subunit [Schistosoma mansoni]|eukprot:XP_018653548.1 LOW QUALITY PROTEIN: putative abc transporter subunit [Schistosoma mansoni]